MFAVIEVRTPHNGLHYGVCVRVMHIHCIIDFNDFTKVIRKKKNNLQKKDKIFGRFSV